MSGKLRGYAFWNSLCLNLNNNSSPPPPISLLNPSSIDSQTTTTTSPTSNNGTSKKIQYVVAPMVDGSELSWRLLSRMYNAQLAYSPMFHALNFSTSAKYRQKEFSTCPEDRPLFVQFCGNNPTILLNAAKYVEDMCDAVDINLGCPQNIAKKGHYGSFLQDEWDLVRDIVQHLDANLKIPVTCKIRVLPTVQESIKYAQMLEKAGCSILTVHGRLREQKGANTGLADWEKIKKIKESVSIPVIANGNILYYEDIQRCLEETGVDAVMSAEGNLYNPAIFSGKNPFIWDISNSYLDLCIKYPASMGIIKGHIFKVCNAALQKHLEFREKIGGAKSIEEIKEAISQLEEKIKSEIGNEIELEPENYETNGPFKIIPYWRCQPLVRRLPTEEESKIWAEKDRKNAKAIKIKFENQSNEDGPSSQDNCNEESDKSQTAKRKSDCLADEPSMC